MDIMNIRRFFKNKKGSITTITAFTLPILIFGIGGAVDYAFALLKKTQLRAAVDSATVAALAYANGHPDDRHAIRDQFLNYLKANLAGTKNLRVREEDIAVQYVPGEQTLRVRVPADVKTYFLPIIRISQWDLEVKAGAQGGLKPTEVVLVLDTTKSMIEDDNGLPSNKLEELKRAAIRFLNIAHEKFKGDKEDFKVAIVPFAEYVKVGMQYRNASWINVPPDRDVDHYHTWYVKWVCVQWEVREGRRYCYRTVRRLRVPPLRVRYKFSVRWQGCVGSRNEPFNLRDDSYSGSRRVPGVMNYKFRNGNVNTYFGWIIWDPNSCEISPVTPLTTLKDHKEELIEKINSLRANGFTYIPAGLIWGWRVLSHKEPFSQGASDEEVRSRGVRKIIILMTDGANTLAPTTRGGRSFADHTRWADIEIANRYTRRLCDNIKAINPATGKPHAEIITITFDVRDPAVRQLMQDCASMGSYDAQSGDLETVFGNIATNLGGIRLIN